MIDIFFVLTEFDRESRRRAGGQGTLHRYGAMQSAEAALDIMPTKV